MTPLAFALIQALIGDGLIPQAIGSLGMASFWQLDHHASIYEYMGLWIAIWLGQIPGWSLSSITGTFEGFTALQDWQRKFKPSAWAIERMNRMFIMDEYIQGTIGMVVRWLCFIPAMLVVHGWMGIIYGVLLSNVIGFIYWLSGYMFRGGKYERYADMTANFMSGMALGGALII